MKHDIKLVAVDVDGTFVRSDYTYHIDRFKKILARMNEVGCNFVVASGHGSIDLIYPGRHKASGLKHLVRPWNITPDQCLAFGDGGNDIEMLQYCAHSFAMANAPDNVKKAAKNICPSNEKDGVLVTIIQVLK